VLRALALAACTNHASALGALAEALTPARGHGYVRVLGHEGSPMHALLGNLPAAGPAPGAGRAASDGVSGPVSPASAGVVPAPATT
jgi:hypothetical protein